MYVVVNQQQQQQQKSKSQTIVLQNNNDNNAVLQLYMRCQYLCRGVSFPFTLIHFPCNAPRRLRTSHPIQLRQLD